MFWLLISGVVLAWLWYNFVYSMNHFARKGVKQTKPLPIFGDTGFRKINYPDFLTSIYNLYPKSRYVGFYQSATPTLIIRDPDLIKQITVKDFDHFVDHKSITNPHTDPLWDDCLLFAKGQKWRETRATLSGSYTSSKMKIMFAVINQSALNFVQHFLNQDLDLIEMNMKDAYTKITNDVIATTAFGIKVDSLADPTNTFYSMGKTLTDMTGISVMFKFFLTMLVPRLSKMLGVSFFSREATDFFSNIIYETIQTREKNHIVRQDMINLLLEAKNGKDSGHDNVVETGFAAVTEQTSSSKSKFKQLKHLTDDDIVSQALVFFFAGFDTVSTVLCFGTYELAVNKSVQDKLRDEILETHRATNGKLTYDALLQMEYLDMVLSEILRKWPPVFALDRVCTKPYTIQPVLPDEQPVEIKVNDLIFLPAYSIQRDPNYYPEPERFDPERFSSENKNNIKPYTYLPFGTGPRNCIGSRFALLEAKVILYNLLLKFEIIPTQKTDVPLKLKVEGQLMTPEKGFWLGLKRLNY